MQTCGWSNSRSRTLILRQTQKPKIASLRNCSHPQLLRATPATECIFGFVLKENSVFSSILFYCKKLMDDFNVSEHSTRWKCYLFVEYFQLNVWWLVMGKREGALTKLRRYKYTKVLKCTKDIVLVWFFMPHIIIDVYLKIPNNNSVKQKKQVMHASSCPHQVAPWVFAWSCFEDIIFRSTLTTILILFFLFFYILHNFFSFSHFIDYTSRYKRKSCEK